MNEKNKIIQDLSVGIIPVNIETNSLRFLLLKHQKGHWGFPKGHPQENEIFIETAIREFNEETGIEKAKIKFLKDFKENIFESDYTFKDKGQIIEKKVIFYLGFLESKDLEIKVQEKEIAEYKWVNSQEAKNLIYYHNTQKIISEVEKYLEGINF